MVSKRGSGEDLTIRDQKNDKLRQVDSFKYLGSMLSSRGGNEKEVRERVKAAWSKKAEDTLYHGKNQSSATELAGTCRESHGRESPNEDKKDGTISDTCKESEGKTEAAMKRCNEGG